MYKNEARGLRATTFGFCEVWRAMTEWGAIEKSLILKSK
jgi:hypothetical protein